MFQRCSIKKRMGNEKWRQWTGGGGRDRLQLLSGGDQEPSPLLPLAKHRLRNNSEPHLPSWSNSSDGHSKPDWLASETLGPTLSDLGEALTKPRTWWLWQGEKNDGYPKYHRRPLGLWGPQNESLCGHKLSPLFKATEPCRSCIWGGCGISVG